MGVGTGDHIGVTGRDRTGGEADGQPGGESVDPGQDGEGTGELLAETGPGVEEESGEGVGAPRRGRGEGVAEAVVLGEVADEGGGLGHGAVGARHDLMGQLDDGGRDGQGGGSDRGPPRGRRRGG